MGFFALSKLEKFVLHQNLQPLVLLFNEPACFLFALPAHLLKFVGMGPAQFLGKAAKELLVKFQHVFRRHLEPLVGDQLVIVEQERRNVLCALVHQRVAQGIKLKEGIRGEDRLSVGFQFVEVQVCIPSNFLLLWGQGVLARHRVVNLSEVPILVQVGVFIQGFLWRLEGGIPSVRSQKRIVPLLLLLTDLDIVVCSLLLEERLYTEGYLLFKLRKVRLLCNFGVDSLKRIVALDLVVLVPPLFLHRKLTRKRSLPQFAFRLQSGQRLEWSG